MAPGGTQKSLIINDENLDARSKRSGIHGKNMSSQPAMKKGGVGRKALNDITNKSSVPLGKTSLNCKASSKKTTVQEDFNVAEEMFLHDHSKCFEAQKPSINALYSDILLLKNDPATFPELSQSEKVKFDLEFKEPEEMPEFDWMASSTKWCSPPCSPPHLDSAPSPIWLHKDVEFVLKGETEGGVL